MMDTVASPPAHGALMDSIYRRQKHIYDATRKYYLFGRDTMIDGLACQPGMNLLEIGCGTGRNLAQIDRRWPGVRLRGLDISQEMLETARQRLGDGAMLALGDATDFNPAALFGEDKFDRVVISFALSMIPQWREAVRHAAGLLAPGGSLHIVDFGNLSGLPGPLRWLMLRWLGAFHVTPRNGLADLVGGLGTRHGLAVTVRRGPLGYYRLVTLTR